MEAEDVESDFKKARAFLLAYSTLILIVWYFSVDLKGFGYLGVAMDIQDNLEDVHLVTAIGNFYFLLRFFQKAPKGSFKLNSDMVSVFEEALKSIAPYIYFFRLRSCVFLDENPSGCSIDYRTIEKKVTMCYQLPEGRSSIIKYWYHWNPGLAERVELSIDLVFFYSKNGQRVLGRVHDKRIIPAFMLVLICQVYAFVKGSFTISWFTDYIFPILYALAAISVSLAMWWSVNYV
ncbi:hypothetical protein [Pseudomonas helleri]|uniref:hypothetical protein n=1 Tax=Pseudomonas helleri TaxID=1608996 RepID=UPI0038254FC0